MKRNKPIIKRRALGTQSKRRRDAGYWSWCDFERGSWNWKIVVAQSVVGEDRTFSMEGAVPAGEDGVPEDPHWKGVLRWRIDRDGRTFFVYSTPPEDTRDTFVVFTAKRRCDEGSRCPLARYLDTDINFSIHTHNGQHCPSAVLGPGLWKRKGLYQKPGKGW